MLGPTLALAVVVLGSYPAADPMDLVELLGSPRYRLRESAEGELAKLGRAALPALKAAKGSMDPEIRTRASAILSRIESSLLLQPTPITLDFRDVPLPDAIEAINRQTGLGLNLSGNEGSNLADRRVTLHSVEPLPFWKAIDALCAGAGLHHAETGQTVVGALSGAFTLGDGYVPTTEPISDNGPFRVSLSSIHLQSEIQLNQPRRDQVRSSRRHNRQFYLQFLVAAEPRLSITQNGPVTLSAVVDDKDQSLLDATESSGFQHLAGYFGLNASPSIRLRVDLPYPSSPGRLIRILRGTIPVVVATRGSDPLVVPLVESVGKSFRTREVDLTLVDYRPARGDTPATIQVALRPLNPANPPIQAGVGEPLGYRAESPDQQIEVLDVQGRPLAWSPSVTLFSDVESRLTLTFPTRGTSGAPATLRYHGVVRSNASVGFEFRDIPIP